MTCIGGLHIPKTGSVILTAKEVKEVEDHIDQLEAENAKLRELCAGLWDVMWACAEQRCPHRHKDCFVVSGDEGCGECWYKRRMRELGVVVDDGQA